MKFFLLLLSVFLTTKIAWGQMTAQDGKTYKTVKIGSQTWSAENLDVATYRNGDSIPHVQDPKVWSDLKTGAWCYYEDSRGPKTSYGKLYNWYAVVDPRGLAPLGWHIPNDGEWTALATAIGGKIGSSPKLKALRGWNSNGNGTNETGFAALPGGTRTINLFSFAGNYGYWWTSSEYDSYSAWNRYIGYNNDDVGRSTGWKQFGNSVRCVKGEVEIARVATETKVNTPTDTTKIETTAPKEEDKTPSVRIGTQVWTLQNLDVSSFQNGDPIPQAKSDSDWVNAGRLKQPAWCYYENDTANGGHYGKLYNWYAVIDKRGLAPKGWHVPTETEWIELIAQVSSDKGGAKLKSTSGWKDRGNGTNELGFNGEPGGFRTNDGIFYNETMGAYWWSSTPSSSESAWYHSVNYFTDNLKSENSYDLEKGLSVRCIKN